MVYGFRIELESKDCGYRKNKPRVRSIKIIIFYRIKKFLI